MWATILKYLGVELIKELGKVLMKVINTWNNKRVAKKNLKIKKEIADAIKKRDVVDLANKFDKL